MEIPFLDLKKQYNSIKDEIDLAILSVINNTEFIGGINIEEFNYKFAKYIGAKYSLGVGNGTDALTIALRSLGLEEGSEVIVPANSFIASSEAVTAAGYKVVFVDCLQDIYTLDVLKAEEYITQNTKAIMPVHIYGQPADMDQVLDLANKYNLKIIEDCAQAHGAKYKGKTVGTFGEIATFSFYPGKNLGAYGDAGAIVTDNEELYKYCFTYANHGRLEKYNHLFEGINSRLDGIQAAVLNVKLKYIDLWNSQRQKAAVWYKELLSDCKRIHLPEINENTLPVYHLFVIRADFRDKLKFYLKKQGISTGIHYPIGLPYSKAYTYLKAKPKDFPVTYENQMNLLSLPIYPEISRNQVEYICNKIIEFYE